MVRKALTSSKTGEWETPQWFFNQLNEEFHFDLDPCSTPQNAKCALYFTREDNGLNQDWTGNVFVNPPYGRGIDRWVEKAYLEAQKGAVIVCLLPARTDTIWWHRWVMKASEIRFVKGRLKFGGSKNGAPFPNVVVIFKKAGPRLVGWKEGRECS